MRIGMRVHSINTNLMFDDTEHLEKFIEKVHACIKKEFEDKKILIACNKKWKYYDTFHNYIQENWGNLTTDNRFTIHFGYVEKGSPRFYDIETLQLFLIINEDECIKANYERFYGIDD